VPLAQNAPGAAARFEERPLVIGWTRDTSRWWGIVHHGHKWYSRQGREQLFDLSVDPEELLPLLLRDQSPARAWRDAFPEALGVPVFEGWRFQVSRSQQPGPVHEAICSVPSGFSRWAIEGDPAAEHTATIRPLSPAEARELLERWDATDHPVGDDDGHVFMSFTGHGPQVYLDTVRPMAEVGYDARCTPRWCVKSPDATRDCPLGTLQIEPRFEAHYGEGVRFPMARLTWSYGRQFTWGKGMTPLGDFVEHDDL